MPPTKNNSIRIEFPSNKDEYAITYCEFVRVVPKFQIEHVELPRHLATKIALLCLKDGFKINTSKWRKDGTRLLRLSKPVIINWDSLAPLNGEYAIQPPKCKYCEELTKLDARKILPYTPKGVSRYEHSLDILLDEKAGREWATHFYRAA